MATTNTDLDCVRTGLPNIRHGVLGVSAQWYERDPKRRVGKRVADSLFGAACISQRTTSSTTTKDEQKARLLARAVCPWWRGRRHQGWRQWIKSLFWNKAKRSEKSGKAAKRNRPHTCATDAVSHTQRVSTTLMCLADHATIVRVCEMLRHDVWVSGMLGTHCKYGFMAAAAARALALALALASASAFALVPVPCP